MFSFQAILFVTVLFGLSDALQCASCTNITHAGDCQNVITCDLGERCYSTSFGIGNEALFDLGCKTEKDCFSSPGVSVIGRSVSNVQCSQCCAVDSCNIQLCSAGTQITNEVGSCADDPNYDCKQFSTLFNICADVAHAKTACRKWCGLCNLVDGAWSVWTKWSSCDVTCGSGHVTRSRSCSDPPPAHGGLQCTGNTTEMNTCPLDPCPIPGGWSSWGTWSPCSNTCSIGTQSRHRACNNPLPAIAGNHCFGDSAEFQACFERSCADGGWSTWSPWTACNDGTQMRNRSCENPVPSQFGRYCIGSDSDSEKCGHVAFTVNYPTGTNTENHNLIFTNVVANLGDGFNKTTGRFTCTMHGLYYFTLTLVVYSSDNVYCYIRKNTRDISFVESHTTSTSVTISLYLSLSEGDFVDVGDCNKLSSISRSIGSSFSGALA